MVSLSQVQSSNSLISSTFPPGLVAIFVGATSGIGEITLKTFAKHAHQPRAYFVGRSQDAGDRIAAECKSINAAGEYIFVKADVSLIRNVDEVCEAIKKKEKVLNILVMSQGSPSLNRSETTEHIHLLAALAHYSRLRFITNLLPLLRRAPSLRRIITVGGGGREGPLDATDLSASHVPLTKIRGHLISLITLSLEAVAQTAPEVSFVHSYPGTVDTPLLHHMEGVIGVVLRAYLFFLGRWVCVPLEECGERQLYLATSAKFPPAKISEGDAGRGECATSVPLMMKEGGGDVVVARGTTGEIGGGVYSAGWDCESALSSPSTGPWKVLAGLREKGMVSEIWRDVESVFRRVAGGNE